MTNNFFEEPDSEFDKKALDEESRRSGIIDWKNKYWKPKAGEENVIRVLQARKGSGAKYHMRAGKHFVKHFEDSRIEAFVCNTETYGKPCCCCEHYDKLIKEGKTEEEARNYKARRFGLFNVVDRSNEAAGVKLYESPVKAVWDYIVRLVASKGRMSNLFDELDEKTGQNRPGRDITIEYDPKRHPAFMYKLFPMDQTPLGSADQIQAWSEDMIDLKPEIIYPETDPDVAYIKTFGSKAERDALREAMKDNRGVEEVEKFEPDSERPQSAAVNAELIVEKPASVANKPEPVAAPPKSASAPAKSAPAPHSTAVNDTISKVRERIEAIKNRAKAGK